MEINEWLGLNRNARARPEDVPDLMNDASFDIA
jgi:hypothetical protein